MLVEVEIGIPDRGILLERGLLFPEAKSIIENNKLIYRLFC